jgi:hypothetical protein
VCAHQVSGLPDSEWLALVTQLPLKHIIFSEKIVQVKPERGRKGKHEDELRV